MLQNELTSFKNMTIVNKQSWLKARIDVESNSEYEGRLQQYESTINGQKDAVKGQ
jgi:uncharacterized protein YqgQ